MDWLVVVFKFAPGGRMGIETEAIGWVESLSRSEFGLKKLDTTAITQTMPNSVTSLRPQPFAAYSVWQRSQNLRLDTIVQSARSIFSPQLQQKFGR